MTTESVSLFVSGYDWECPCGEFNHVSSFHSQVTCDACEKTYYVQDVIDAD